MESLQKMAVRAAVNQHEIIKKFGRVQKLEIDTLNHQIQASLMLKGESQVVDITITYEFSDGSNQESKWLEIATFNCNREWINLIYETYTASNGKPKIILKGTLAKVFEILL